MTNTIKEQKLIITISEDLQSLNMEFEPVLHGTETEGVELFSENDKKLQRIAADIAGKLQQIIGG